MASTFGRVEVVVIGRRLGPYEVLEKLGAGGMGEVYRARDTTLQRDVAIKVLPAGVTAEADRLARFRREAEVLASLNHPHIAQVYGVEMSSDGPALIMEYVDGRTLDAVIGGRAMAWDEALPIARQIALALEAAHERGVVHRDLKPANVKITDAGQVKVLDFGLAKAVGPDAAVSAGNLADSPTGTAYATTLGVILGTAAYMAPEQARGRPVDRRVDIWAFGAVFYEMLTGRRAFEGENTTELLAAVVRDEPNWTRLPPDAVRATPLIRRALKKGQSNRTQHIGDMRIALDELLDSPGASSPAASPRPRSLRTLLFGAGCLAVASAIGVGIGMWLSGSRSMPAPFHFQLPYTQISINTGGNTVGALSPTGSHLAFASLEGAVQWLWVREFKTGTVKKVPGSEGAFDPFWAADGQRIAFFAADKLLRTDLHAQPAIEIAPVGGTAVGGRSGTWNAEDVILFRKGPGPIRRVNASGGAVTPVPLTLGSASVAVPTFPRFLPDGRHFLFLARAATGEQSVLVADLDGGEARQVLSSASSFEIVDGPAILFARDNRLLFQRLNRGGDAPVGATVVLGEDVDVVPDGEVAQFTAGGNMVLYKPSFAGIRFQWANVQGHLLRGIESDAIRLGARERSGFSMAPKDDRLAVARLGSNSPTLRISILDLQSGKLVDEADGWWPAWSPNGLQIAFRRGDELIIRTVGTNKERAIRIHNASRPLWTSNDEIVVARNGTVWFVNVLTEEQHQQPLGRTVTSIEDVSANGKLLAFMCDNSGRAEVCVARLDGTGPVTQISNLSGQYARWARAGTDLYLLQDGRAWKTTVSEASLSISPLVEQFQLTLAASSELVTGLNIARDGNILRSVENRVTALLGVRDWQSAVGNDR